MPEDTEDQTVYRVVINDEEQYSIWPTDRDVPAGWRQEGKEGLRADCLAHIDEAWTDMRPLSLRLHMAEMERKAAEAGAEPDADELADEEETLVSRLSRGEHPVEVSLRPEPTGQALQEAVGRGYVYLRFTQTRGGTELGIRLDPGASDFTQADFGTPGGQVRIVGDLTLDFEPVRCVAEIDLATMAGHGRLAAAGESP